ncbi:MAG TPA: Stp1/IreP family PP2C-type Ser/Thr phosphatase [Polyangiaceae bacterium]|nr:Stp1/IreP family PP2C-type Ser/Thr phosphatase [Polyangiaceae bacterium]
MSERPREEPQDAAKAPESGDDGACADGADGTDEAVDDERSDSEAPKVEASSDPPAASDAPKETSSDPPPSSGDAAAVGEEDDGEEKDSDDGDEKGDESGVRGVIRVELFGQTDVGQIREHNEDNFLVADLSSKQRGVAGSNKSFEVGQGGLLLAVCDGMGGAAAGEVASQMAADVIYENMLRSSGHQDRDRLAIDIVDALEDAGKRILDEANANRACRGMGTTATVAALVDDYLLLGQVGDSRAYVLRDGRLVQVTRDQSLVNQLIEAGQLTEEEAENFEHSNIILQALGTADAVQVDLTYVALRRGDVLMMCSDGLSGMIRDSEIRDTLEHVRDPLEACQVLIDDANQAGGHDNITVIVAVFDGDGLEPPSEEDVASLKYDKYALPAWIDDQADATRRVGALSGDYDDTPLIEITGEFEIDPETSWDDLLDDRPHIPKEQGPGMSNMVILVAVAVLVFALYYLIAR